MKIIKSLTLIVLFAVIAMIGCKQKDADIKTAVETRIAAVPSLAGVTVDVHEGLVTLGGELKDESTKALAETTTKAAKGVKSVVNNINIIKVAPVTIAVDDVLTQTVKDAIKDYPTVTAAVKDGIVTLNGEIKKDGLQQLMMALSALKPKKIENKLTVK